MSSYEFTNTWFEVNRELWDQLLPRMRPGKILEIGAYEGASTCYLIDTLSPDAEIEIHCVDTWQGSVEHQADGMYPADMQLVEDRFYKNTLLATKKARNRVDLNVYKSPSVEAMTAFVASGKASYFDFIYLDGSHQAPDVLLDAVLAFQLLNIGGNLVFDDYCWSETTLEQVDSLRCPKIAIDAFVNIYRRKLSFLEVTKNQMFIQKTAD